MSITAQRYLSIAVSVVLAMLAAVQLASPESLGISAVMARWLGILATGLGILASFLPRVQGPSTDPDALADRVWNLPAADREQVANELAHRAERQARAHMVSQSPGAVPPKPPVTEEQIRSRIIGSGGSR